MASHHSRQLSNGNSFQTVPPAPGETWQTSERINPNVVRLKDALARQSDGIELDHEVQRIANVLKSLRAKCHITCVDYCAGRIQVHSGLRNDNLAAFLERDRPPWSKVRWMHVEGISGDVLQTLAVQYDLHPLALDDVARFQPIKHDIYEDSILVSIYAYDLERTHAPEKGAKAAAYHTPSGSSSSGSSASSSSSDYSSDAVSDAELYGSGKDDGGETRANWHALPDVLVAPDEGPGGSAARPDATSGGGRGGVSSKNLKPAKHKVHTSRPGRRTALRRPIQAPYFDFRPKTVRAFKKKKVMLEQVSLFMLADGTVISLFEHTGAAIGRSIMDRLVGMQSLMLESEDPGMLMQALVQATLEYSIPVFDAFARQVSKLDTRVLQGGARVKLTRRLHVLHTLLTILLRSFAPLDNMLTTLVNNSSSRMPGGAECKVQLSQLCRSYIEDTQDMASSFEQDIVALMDHSQHLIDLLFNTISHSNEAANMALALLSTLFLPLTFLAGVYGMNFEVMPELAWPLGYLYFWMLALGVLTASLLVGWYSGLIKPRWRWLRRMRLWWRGKLPRAAEGARQGGGGAAKSKRKKKKGKR